MNPLDAKLLPVVSVLLEAGYRLTGAYHNVPVRRSWGSSIEIVERFDPITDDPRLDLAGKNR